MLELLAQILSSMGASPCCRQVTRASLGARVDMSLSVLGFSSGSTSWHREKRRGGSATGLPGWQMALGEVSVPTDSAPPPGHGQQGDALSVVSSSSLAAPRAVCGTGWQRQLGLCALFLRSGPGTVGYGLCHPLLGSHSPGDPPVLRPEETRR